MIGIPHETLLLALGLMILLAAWLPLLLDRLPLSLPILCIGAGLIVAQTDWVQSDTASLSHNRTLEYLNEGIVLIALMGAGLRLDRPFAWRDWGSTWRLLGIAMPLTMAGIGAAAYWGLGFPAAAALLLAAALAPTDPVLAADVQTGPPKAGEDGETRFGLTSEAGLNDGLAFPFILLAVTMQAGPVDWAHWAVVQVLGDLAIGVAFGWAAGRIAGYAMFRLSSMKLSETGDGLVAIGVTFAVYALTALVHGNGFVAVFVAALTIRSTCPDDAFHTAMSDFSGQIERVLMTVVMILFGWALGRGLLTPLDWRGALLAVAIVLVIRPLAGLVSFAGADTPQLSKRLMGFFGIRGIGTLFYLQYAFSRATFGERSDIWAIAGLTILGSIILHGVTATPLMRHADAARKRRAATTDS